MDTRHQVVAAIKSYLQRDRFSDDVLTAIARHMQDGYLVVRLGYVPVKLERLDSLRFSASSIDWDLTWEPITNTCQLYLHFLEPVKSLVQAYEVTGDADVLELAVEIAHGWVTYAQNDGSSKFTWYDHCAAERAGILMYLGQTVSEARGVSDPFLDELEAVLAWHGTFLADDGNYSTQNHGTMMDRSLYLISHYLTGHPEAESWREKALSRLRTAVERDYSERVVNLENSSSYHLFNFDLYVSLEMQILQRFGDSLATHFDEWKEKAARFLVDMSKPDLSFPVIGDGSRMSFDAFSHYASFGEFAKAPEVKYLLSDGVEGVAPTCRFTPYPSEGYCFMRTAWAPPSQAGTVAYASFRSGKMISNHKHADDLSFTYFAQGRDIFVDPGTYTYQPGDFRRFFLSARAHNSLVVDDSTYPITAPMDGAFIASTQESDTHFLVEGINTLFPGVQLRRKFFFLTSGAIVIVDDATSDADHRYSQFFHFSHRLDARVLRLEGQTLSCVSDDVVVRLVQLRPTSVVIHRGKPDTPGLGLVSEGFNELHATTSLEYIQSAPSTRFITGVSVDPASGPLSDFRVEEDGDRLRVRHGTLETLLTI